MGQRDGENIENKGPTWKEVDTLVKNRKVLKKFSIRRVNKQRYNNDGLASGFGATRLKLNRFLKGYQ